MSTNIEELIQDLEEAVKAHDRIKTERTLGRLNKSRIALLEVVEEEIPSTTNCPLCGEDCIDNNWNCECLTKAQQEIWYTRHNQG